MLRGVFHSPYKFHGVIFLKKSGFTLIEILCCLAILSVILAFSYIDSDRISKTMSKKQFKTTSQRFLADLRFAQLYALSEGWIKVKISDDGYLVYNPSNLDKMVIINTRFPKGISFDRINSTIPIDRTIAFTDIGTISPYACTIAIKDDYGNTASISIKVASLTIGYKQVTK